MVAAARRRAYNRRNKSRGLGSVDWLVNALEPLINGDTKVLVMDTPTPPRKGMPSGSTRQQLVALAPGTLYGFAANSVMISVIGAGSCVIHPLEQRQLSRMILAGIPPFLANVLFNGLTRLYRSYSHGTTDSSHTSTRGPGRTFRVACKVVPRTGRQHPATPPRRR